MNKFIVLCSLIRTFVAQTTYSYDDEKKLFFICLITVNDSSRSAASKNQYPG